MKKILAVLLIVFIISGGVGYFVFKSRPGVMEQLSNALDNRDPQDWCATRSASHRHFVVKVLDRFRPQLNELWANRKDEDKLDPKEVFFIGTFPLRKPPPVIAGVEFDRSVWSWEEAFSRIQDSQRNPEPRKWLSVDTMANYLLRKEKERRVDKVNFLEPKLTKHFFRPNTTVHRVGENEIAVHLHPGIFIAEKDQVKKLIEKEWAFGKKRLMIIWDEKLPEAYRFYQQESSARSLVNHDKRAIFIAPNSPMKTLAHEVGHVLGFDDHYYDVWHAQNCYYTQEFRTSDLMSDSESGRVHQFHWKLLTETYPWPPTRKPAATPFIYLYQNSPAAN